MSYMLLFCNPSISNQSLEDRYGITFGERCLVDKSIDN